MNTKSYLVFTTPGCPNCPAVKEHLSKLDLEGKPVDASTPEGLDEARKYGVSTVPTVIFLDEENKELGRAQSISEVDEYLSKE